STLDHGGAADTTASGGIAQLRAALAEQSGDLSHVTMGDIPMGSGGDRGTGDDAPYEVRTKVGVLIGTAAAFGAGVLAANALGFVALPVMAVAGDGVAVATGAVAGIVLLLAVLVAAEHSDDVHKAWRTVWARGSSSRATGATAPK